MKSFRGVAKRIHWKMQSLADSEQTAFVPLIRAVLVRVAHIRKPFTRLGNVYVVLVAETEETIFENETYYKYSFNWLWQWSGSSTIKLCSLVRSKMPHIFQIPRVVSVVSSLRWDMCKVWWRPERCSGGQWLLPFVVNEQAEKNSHTRKGWKDDESAQNVFTICTYCAVAGRLNDGKAVRAPCSTLFSDYD